MLCFSIPITTPYIFCLKRIVFSKRVVFISISSSSGTPLHLIILTERRSSKEVNVYGSNNFIFLEMKIDRFCLNLDFLAATTRVDEFLKKHFVVNQERLFPPCLHFSGYNFSQVGGALADIVGSLLAQRVKWICCCLSYLCCCLS